MLMCYRDFMATS